MSGPTDAQPFSDDLRMRFARVRLLSLDVDGVLTDGGLYYDDEGRQQRRFNVRDGQGIKTAMAAGIAVALITASTTEAIRHRAATLGIDTVRLGATDKLAALEAVAGELGLGLADVAHVGDDTNDVPVLSAVGLPMTVADGVAEVRTIAAYVTARPGGGGAVREICDLLVASRQSS